MYVKYTENFNIKISVAYSTQLFTEFVWRKWYGCPLNKKIVRTRICVLIWLMVLAFELNATDKNQSTKDIDSKKELYGRKKCDLDVNKLRQVIKGHTGIIWDPYYNLDCYIRPFPIGKPSHWLKMIRWGEESRLRKMQAAEEFSRTVNL